MVHTGAGRQRIPAPLAREKCFHLTSPFIEPAAVLDRSRLAKEDTLCHDSLTEAERKWLRVNRPPEAAHWNLLTDMKAENLPHGRR